MNFQSIIATRRDKQRHTEDDLRFLSEGAAKGTIPDYQLAAWLMAAFLNPLDDEETLWLTRAMADSGDRIDLTGLPKPWVDKHSTGGVGDKTSIILLPLLASCGLTLVKMSGRGLGITGGTVDKLHSVPGFRLDLSPEEMKAQAARIGLAITGQSPDLAPADKVLYGLRDVTGTTASIPLLVSSILCKKLAGGAETVVLDVKAGSGNFMHDEAGARALASALSKTAKACGLNCRLALTDMDQPLGNVGNALEIEEARRVLRNDLEDPSRARVAELCVQLAGLTLAAAGKCPTQREGVDEAKAALASGRAYSKAREWFEAQGGDIEADLPDAAIRREIGSRETGWVGRIDAETIGRAVIELGGGRHKKEDTIDPSVGIEVHTFVGRKVSREETLFTVHAASEDAFRNAEEQVQCALAISREEVPVRPLILEMF